LPLFRPGTVKRSSALILFGFVFAAIFVVFAFDVTSYRITEVPQTQGRYGLLGLPALIILAVAGMRDLIPRHFAPTLATALATAMVCLNVAALWTLWNAFDLP